MLQRALTLLSSFLLRLRLATARGGGPKVALALSRHMEDGSTWGSSVRAVAPLICDEALRDASARFEGGPAALLIVDLRDALTRIFTEAGVALCQRHSTAGPWLKRNLGELARQIRTDDTVQRLVNCVLAEAGLFSEAQLLDLETLDRERLTTELAQLLTRLVSARLTVSQASHRLDTPPAGYKLTDRLAKA